MQSLVDTDLQQRGRWGIFQAGLWMSNSVKIILAIMHCQFLSMGYGEDGLRYLTNDLRLLRLHCIWQTPTNNEHTCSRGSCPMRISIILITRCDLLQTISRFFPDVKWGCKWGLPWVGDSGVWLEEEPVAVVMDNDPELWRGGMPGPCISYWHTCLDSCRKQCHQFTSFTPRVNYGDIKCSSNFWVCFWNPMVWPFTWNLF